MDYMPFNSINGDRVYKAEDWAWYFSTFIGNGVFPSPSTGLQVLASDGMTIAVQPGFGFVNGYAFRCQTAYNLTVETADGVMARIDRVVLQWSLTDRLMQLVIKKGTASNSPVAPELVRTAEVYELALADIAVDKGTTALTQSMITDDRYDSSLCGICAGIITQIDASTLTAQFNAFFDEYVAKVKEDYANYTDSIEDYESNWKTSLESWETESKQAFTDWFNLIKDQLGEDSAGKLQNQINDIRDSYDIATQAHTTEFMNDGSIKETLADGRYKTTVFNSDGSITETFSKTDGTVTGTKTTVFNSDGSISETVAS